MPSGIVNLSGALLAMMPIQSHIPNASMITTGVLDFTSVNQYVLDLSSLSGGGFNRLGIQSIYIDNYNNAGIFTVLVAGTNHRILVEPGYQGFFPLIVTGPGVMTFLCDVQGGAGSPAQTTVWLMNIPMVAQTWKTRIYGPQNKVLYGNFNPVSPASKTLTLLTTSGQILTITAIQLWLEANQNTGTAGTNVFDVGIGTTADGTIFNSAWAIPASGAAYQTFPVFATPGGFSYTCSSPITSLQLTVSSYTAVGVDYMINYGYL